MNELQKFFVPHAADEAMALDVWQKLRNRYGSTDQKIHSLTWEHKGVTHRAEVGKAIERFGENAGPVIVILRSHSCYMVFTAFRGVLGDVPVMVGDDEYLHHTEFSD